MTKAEISKNVEQILMGARNARSEVASSEAAVQEALALAPEDLSARMGAYKLYLYNHRLDEAALQAEWLLRHFAAELGVSADWREVRTGDAPFTELEFKPRRYLQALIALGYCRARNGDLAFGRAALEKAQSLDPADRFGAGRLIASLDRRARGAAEDD